MSKITPTHLLAALAWASVFTLSWLLILGRVSGAAPWSFLAFFSVLAVVSAAVASPSRKD